jgi:pimeloyl-ACP methyl ester carboxylesterase
MIATTTSTSHEADEPTLLMLPGWCDDRAAFDPLLVETGRSRRTVSLDWRGHGASAPASGDFGIDELVADAIEVVEETGAKRVVPVAGSHAGWVAIELRRRLGDRVAAIVLLDWMVLGPPPGFDDALAALQDPSAWTGVRNQLFARWTEGVDHPGVLASIGRMTGHGYEMWARAGREIAAAFATQGPPVEALAPLDCPVLHLYAQPADPGFLAGQEAFAAEHGWFEVQRLDARSHFPMLEVPGEVAERIEKFVLSRT